MQNEKLRKKLSQKGVEYVKKVHNVDNFIQNLRTILHEEARC